MMRDLIAKLFLTVGVLLGSAQVSFALPPCPENGYRHNCFGTNTWTHGKFVGDQYSGGYKNGKKHGQGTYTYGNGGKYVGEFRNDKRHGQGTYTPSPNGKFAGSKFVGEYRNGRANGQGTYTSANGAKYVGEYRDNKRNGRGTYTSASGAKYVGEYKNGKPHGQGTLYAADGTVEKQGIWKGDKFQYAQKDNPPAEASGDRNQGVIEYAIRLTGLERCRASNSYWSDCLNVYQRGQSGNVYGNIVGWWLQYYVQNKIERTIKISGSATIQSLPKRALMSLDPSRSSSPTRIVKPRTPKVTKPAPSYANLSDPRLCKKALNASRTSWNLSEKYKLYSNAAKGRGLTIKYCGLVLGISKPKPPVRVVSKKPKYVHIGTGSGFSITKQGHILTNHHVVKNCKFVVVHLKQTKLKKAVIIAEDKQNDLALLKASFTPEAVYSISQTNPQELDDIIVAGFPLSGTLSSSVKMTRGIVSSLAGVRNDYSRIQIDAAVQPGNSGGPIINPNGTVVAVAVSILKKEYFRKRSGIIPENTNFGIKASVVRNFLEANEVVLSNHSANTEISRTSIRDLIKRAAVRKLIKGGTYLLSCWSTRAVQQKLAKGRRPAINVNPGTYELIKGILK